MTENIKRYLEAHSETLIEDALYTNYKFIQKLFFFTPGEIKYEEYNELVEILKEFGYIDIEKVRHARLYDILDVKRYLWQRGKSKDKKFIKLQVLINRYKTNNNFYGYTLSDIEKVCLEYGQLGDLKFSLYDNSDPSKGVLVEYMGA